RAHKRISRLMVKNLRNVVIKNVGLKRINPETTISYCPTKVFFISPVGVLALMVNAILSVKRT
ncbi:hypothetical protein, partial [Klebsiella pneumoniae]|uniref:hypothetical protein n=1 Tax=Klebsiella pneumoniae TaxID=573 RepID=UPI001C70964A